MGTLQVKRVTLNERDEFEKIEFPFKCGKYMIKNFSNHDIFVSFDADATEDDSIKIESGYYQEVIANEWLGGEPFKTNEIYIMGIGEVEVQQLCFH